ncbi:MAG TPA: WecB/TagA/CpsF family glycosyltransferase [Chloroflexia bacterium]|nr:WecB/TagA/CpsF family glycosyltransferase [Chloroflexia bacterium]
MRKRNILGVGVHDCDEDEALEQIVRFLSEEPPKLHQVCTVNPEFVMEARRTPAFRSVINGASLATPDGVGIVLAGTLLGKPFKGRATGVALVQRLAWASAERGLSIFLLGAGPGVAEEAARVLEARYPGLRIAGTYAGSPSDEDFASIRVLLEAARPDLLFVAYGAPRQDMWIAQHMHDLPSTVRVAMGIGGVLDYLSGRVPLAPPLMRRAGLEWVYRLARQPWRWRRILKVFAFGVLVLRERASRGLPRVAGARVES